MFGVNFFLLISTCAASNDIVHLTGYLVWGSGINVFLIC